MQGAAEVDRTAIYLSSQSGRQVAGTDERGHTLASEEGGAEGRGEGKGRESTASFGLGCVNLGVIQYVDW